MKIKKIVRNLFWICLLCTVLFFGLFHWICPEFINRYFPGKYSGPYEVVHISDGDTITVMIDDHETVIRLIGVDTPESVDPDKTKNCEEGKTASDFTASLLSNQYVYLEYDEEKTDRYGRTLAYVYLNQKMVEEILLEEGMAKVMIIEPNDRYEEMLKKAEYTARENNKGFWAEDFWSEN